MEHVPLAMRSHDATCMNEKRHRQYDSMRGWGVRRGGAVRLQPFWFFLTATEGWRRGLRRGD